MRKMYLIFLIGMIIFLFQFDLFKVGFAVTNDEAIPTAYDEIAKSEKGDIILYATKMNVNDVYTDFKIDFKGVMMSRPFWINTTSPTWLPEIINADINGDGKQELIIILTRGTGTGIVEREVHVFHIQNQQLGKMFFEVPVEMLVDDPIAIVLKNVKTKMSSDKATISIGDKNYTIDIKSLGIQPEVLFTDIYFGNIINFEIKDNQLIAKVGGIISPTGYIGSIQITYMFKDNMYQAKTIDFMPNK
ncbi:hypothetical protein [Sporosarcina sp. YIM B06819]|uniref:hypothetical protein n=1 Tax=Sporosarcina sp. YIM B06819 TaxID=3081769 RepID=UPI00298C47B9|nr:hypothetical protein [Sporosarcina sp. YIM B06819]